MMKLPLLKRQFHHRGEDPVLYSHYLQPDAGEYIVLCRYECRYVYCKVDVIPVCDIFSIEFCFSDVVDTGHKYGFVDIEAYLFYLSGGGAGDDLFYFKRRVDFCVASSELWRPNHEVGSYFYVDGLVALDLDGYGVWCAVRCLLPLKGALSVGYNEFVGSIEQCCGEGAIGCEGIFQRAGFAEAILI